MPLPQAPVALSQFDLGVDVSTVQPTPEAALLFLSSLPTDQKGAVIKKCGFFMDHPAAARAMETMVFCSMATQGTAKTGL
jgi:hypothetical protein